MHPGIDGIELGHYRVTRLLGSGGMGDVYLARDLVLGRDVAVKVVTTAREHGDTLIRRLLHEAKAVAALDHPWICPVHDAGVDPSGRPYMVMQYVPGETLATRLQRGPLPVRDALLLAIRIADALALAHARGIVHRDLKPQNVMITPSGEPRLLDFGIAKILPSASSSTTDTFTALTGSYALVGTPAYMSPEQVRQQPVDGRSDLFSLGAILFETLTGRRAFLGRQTTEVLSEILQVHPPAVSELQPELDERHDEICRRLLAKDPLDRFQSAEQVLGALRVVLPDTSRTTHTMVESVAVSWWRTARDVVLAPGWKPRTALAVAVTTVLAVALFWGTRSFTPSRSVPPDAAIWFDNGTRALREGAFHTAAIALEEGLAKYPDHAIAYARLAEARAELDDERGAQQALVRLSERVPDLTRLPRDQQLRIDAVRALVLDDIDRAVGAYRALAERQPRDASGWLDLGRAQEEAALLPDAAASYQRAVTLDPQYAAGHLRVGIVAAAEGRRDAALEAYAEADHLYSAASNAEGKAEVSIRRALVYDGKGEYTTARAALNRALALAASIDDTFYLVRAQMILSSLTASAGDYAEAERIASTAVQAAIDAGLDTVAADGLIDVAATLQTSRPAEARALLVKSAAMADKRGARRISARAVSQLASLQLAEDPAQALATIQPALAFFKDHHYRKYERQALIIAARAYQRIDDIPRARELTMDLLRESEASGDENQVGLALTNLALLATVLGALPEALEHRARAEAIHRKQNDLRSLPYDLTNRAEVLILLGQRGGADEALREVEAGIAKNILAFVERQARVRYLRFLEAAISHRSRDAVAIAQTTTLRPAGVDNASVLVPLMLAYTQGRQRQPVERVPLRSSGTPALPPALQREARYWESTALLHAGKPAEALEIASAGLPHAARLGNDELRWRLAAIGAAAAHTLGRNDEARTLRETARDAWARLRTSWGNASAAYGARPDLTELRKAAGI